MEKLSLREAVKHFDVSRPTLQKALKIGKKTKEDTSAVSQLLDEIKSMKKKLKPKKSKK